MPNSVMILVFLTLWLPRGFADFPKKTNFLIEVFPFRGLLIIGGSIASKSLDRCSYELLERYGFFPREICDTCGIVLGAVRFARHNESKVYCSRGCRGDAHTFATLRPGRPRKYKTDRERRAAKTRQQQVYRVAS